MLSDSRFWIGAVVGAAAVYFLLPKITGGSKPKAGAKRSG